jgi:hypothetical protein
VPLAVPCDCEQRDAVWRCGEHDCVFEGLPAALPEVGRHRVRRVAEQDDAASVISVKFRQPVDVVAEYELGWGVREHCRDRLMPGPESAAQLLASVDERHHPEFGASAPAQAHLGDRSRR